MDSRERMKVLIVDDAKINRALLASILKEEYDILEADSAEAGLALMEEHIDLEKRKLGIALVLLDEVMPGMDGIALLKIMKERHWIERIPVIMVSSENSQELIGCAFDLGVVDFIPRPFDSLIVRKRVRNTLLLFARQEKLAGLVVDQVYENEANSSMLVQVLSNIVEFRNGESGAHVLHIRTLTRVLLQDLCSRTDRYKLSSEDIYRISTASALHDIGKIAIPDAILNKPGRLTKEEFDIMKTHSMEGANMLERNAEYLGESNQSLLLKTAYEICRWHHERWDGRGYPDGLRGEDIPISAQIVSIADVYDALTSERVYKAAFSHEKAMAMILNGECGIFNPLLLECLKNCQDIEQAFHADKETRTQDEMIKEFDRELLQHAALLSSGRILRVMSSVDREEEVVRP